MNPFEGYRVSSPFGWRNSPFGNGQEFHTGIDLVKGHQQPINAFAEGEVLFAGMGQTGTGFGGYGNVVAVKDKQGSLQAYAHLDSVAVQVNDHVTKGEVIGYQGTTGKSTGSHLHFEVRKTCSPQYGWIADRQNNCYDPSEYLQSLEVQEKKTNFPDVEAGRWSEGAITAVSGLGLMIGYPDGSFKPEQPLTREEAAMLVNNLVYWFEHR